MQPGEAKAMSQNMLNSSVLRRGAAELGENFVQLQLSEPPSFMLYIHLIQCYYNNSDYSHLNYSTLEVLCGDNTKHSHSGQILLCSSRLSNAKPPIFLRELALIQDQQFHTGQETRSNSTLMQQMADRDFFLLLLQLLLLCLLRYHVR